jgi:hypothetical protein
MMRWCGHFSSIGRGPNDLEQSSAFVVGDLGTRTLRAPTFSFARPVLLRRVAEIDKLHAPILLVAHYRRGVSEPRGGGPGSADGRISVSTR